MFVLPRMISVLCETSDLDESAGFRRPKSILQRYAILQYLTVSKFPVNNVLESSILSMPNGRL